MEVAAMDPPEDDPGRVAPSVDITPAGTPAGGVGTGIGRFRAVGPGPSSDSPPRIETSGNPGRQSARLGVGILSNIPVASVVNERDAGSGRSWQSQRQSVINDGQTRRSPATSPTRTRDTIASSPLRELRGYARTETARRGPRRSKGADERAPNTPEVKTGATPDETARWKSSLREEIRGENARPRDSAMHRSLRQPRVDESSSADGGREAAIDALIAEHEDALAAMKDEMDGERAEMLAVAERIKAEASEGVAAAAAQWHEERKFLNLRADELETQLKTAAQTHEHERTEAAQTFATEKATLEARLRDAQTTAAGVEAKMTERFDAERRGFDERAESIRAEAAAEVAAARDAQGREHERCKAEVDRANAQIRTMLEDHAVELREATEHLETSLARFEENAARRLEQKAAAWTQERESLESEAEATRVVLQTQLDAAKEDASAYREHVEGKLATLTEEAETHRRRAREAREVAAEAESIRAEAVASAEAWRKEAELARAFAESARIDAQTTLASERAAINEELEAMREAHEVRVATARRDLEEERARDAEKTGNAVAAAEEGVAAALAQASASISREAAAFSTALTLRAWWFHAKYRGSTARQDAVNALVGTKTRALARCAVREWWHAACTKRRVPGAVRAYEHRAAQSAWIAWARHCAFRKFLNDRAAEYTARRDSERARQTKLGFMRLWQMAVRYEDHVRVAHNRVNAKHRIATLRRYVRAWLDFSKTEGLLDTMIERFAERRRAARIRSVFHTWFVTVCADRHEDNLAAAATQKFWSYKGRRVLRGWYAASRELWLDRRVAGSYHVKVRRRTIQRCFHSWRHHRRDEQYRRNMVAKAKRHHAGRVKTLAMKAWRSATEKSRRRRVALRRFRKRLERKRLFRGFIAWRTASHFALQLPGMVTEMHHRRVRRRGAQVCFYAWRREVRATAARFLQAAAYNGRHHTSRAFRRWRALTSAKTRGVRSANDSFARRLRESAARAVAALRSNAVAARMVANGCAVIAARRRRQARSRAFAAWASSVSTTNADLTRHRVMRRNRRAKYVLEGWFRVMMQTRLATTLEKRREIAIQSFVDIRNQRLAVKALKAWVTYVDVATRHERCVAKMRTVRLARVTLVGWRSRVAAAVIFRTAMTTRLGAAASSRVTRAFNAWRVLVEVRGGARTIATRGFIARDRERRLVECLRRWVEVGSRAMDRRAEYHVRKVTRWRAKMALKVWRVMKRGATYRLDVERAEEVRATTRRETALARRFSRRWRETARVKATERIEDVRAWQCACRHLARWGARCFIAWYRAVVVDNRRVRNHRGRVLDRKALGAIRAWRLDTFLGEKSRDSRRSSRGDALARRRVTRGMIACARAWYAEAASKRRGREVAERMVRRHAHARLVAAWRAWAQLALAVSAYREEAEIGCVAAWKHRGVARVFQAWRAVAWNTHSKHPHRIAWMNARLERKRLRHALSSFIGFHCVLTRAKQALEKRLVKTTVAAWFATTKSATDARTHQGVNIWRSERKAWTRARVTTARAVRVWSLEAKRLGYLRRRCASMRRNADVTKRLKAFTWWRYETTRCARDENRVRNMEHRVLTMWRRRLDWDNLAAGHADVFLARNVKGRSVSWFRAWATEAAHGAFVRGTRAALVERLDPRRLKRWAFYAWHRRLWLKARTGARLYTQESTSWKLLIRSDAGTGTDDSRSEIGTGTDDSLFALATLASIPEAHASAPVVIDRPVRPGSPGSSEPSSSAPASPLAPAPTPAGHRADTPRASPGDDEFAFSPLAPDNVTPDNVRQLRRELDAAREEAADAREDLAAAEEILREMNETRVDTEAALDAARREAEAAHEEARAYAQATRSQGTTPPASPRSVPGSPLRSPSGGGPANIFDLAYGETFADADPLTPEPSPRAQMQQQMQQQQMQQRPPSPGPPVREDDEDVSSAFKSWRARETRLMERLLEAQTLAEIAEARVVAAEAEAEAATAAAAHLGWKPPHADAPEGKSASALPPSTRDFRAELEACEARLASVLETTEREKEKTLESLQKAEEDAENARKLAESDRVAFAARFGDMNSRAVRLETAFNDAERETAEAKDVIKRLEGKIEELEGKIESQKKKLRKSGGDVESLTEALLADTAAVNERNAALAKELTAARQAKDEVDKKLVAAVAARKETQSKLAESNKLRAELEAQLGKLKDRLEKDIEDAAEQDDKIKSLNGDVARVTALLAKSDAKRLDLEKRADAADLNVRDISGKLDESTAREHDLTTKLAAVEPSIARANEELRRIRELHAASEKTAASLRDEKETLDAKLERANSTATIAWKRCQDLSSRLNGWVRKGVDDVPSGGSYSPPRVLEELTDALNTARKDASNQSRRADDAEARALNLASSEMLLKSRLEDKKRVAHEANEAILASAEKASGDIAALSGELAGLRGGGYATPKRGAGTFTQTPHSASQTQTRTDAEELAEEVDKLRAELERANERLERLNEDYGEFDAEMDKHDKAELVAALAEARAALATTREENLALRAEAAAAVKRGPGLFPDSPGEESGEEEAARVDEVRAAAASLKGAAKVRVALGASLGNAVDAAASGRRKKSGELLEHMDELAEANESMRATIVSLTTERDALKSALAESTRREAAARESLRELKRASLEDAMAMSTYAATREPVPMSAVEAQLGELESLVGELARRVPQAQRRR